MRNLTLCFAVIMVFLLTGCGNKGDLYLPDKSVEAHDTAKV